MSDAKRVAFTTISNTVSSSTIAAAAAAPEYRANSLVFGSNGPENGNGHATGASSKTFRLDLTLFQTDSSKYPEFNYSRLMHLEKKKFKKLKLCNNGIADDPFVAPTNDDEVARIARQLEEKYGTAYGSGRSRARKNDLSDKGRGYDESDSFIDNTEAYDEVLPEGTETIEGGFYINCGALEFKKLQTESTTTKTDEIIKMPNRPKKRVISSSSSEDSSTTDEDDEADDDDDDEEDEEEEADDSSATNNRQKSGNTSSSTTNSITVNNSHKNKDKQIDAQKTIALSCSSSNSPKPTGDGSDSDKDRVPIKTTTVKDMLKAKRDNFLKLQGNETNTNGQVQSTGSHTTDDEDEDSTTSSDETDESENSAQSALVDKKVVTSESTVVLQNEAISDKHEVKLPAGLDAVLCNLLHTFKDNALAKGFLGKKFQFDDFLREHFLR